MYQIFVMITLLLSLCTSILAQQKDMTFYLNTVDDQRIYADDILELSNDQIVIGFRNRKIPYDINYLNSVSIMDKKRNRRISYIAAASVGGVSAVLFYIREKNSGSFLGEPKPLNAAIFGGSLYGVLAYFGLSYFLDYNKRTIKLDKSNRTDQLNRLRNKLKIQ